MPKSAKKWIFENPNKSLDGLPPFFISSMNVLFHGKHKNGITIELFEEGRSRAQKTLKNSIFGRKKFLSNCPHHV